MIGDNRGNANRDNPSWLNAAAQRSSGLLGDANVHSKYGPIYGLMLNAFPHGDTTEQRALYGIGRMVTDEIQRLERLLRAANEDNENLKNMLGKSEIEKKQLRECIRYTEEQHAQTIRDLEELRDGLSRYADSKEQLADIAEHQTEQGTAHQPETDVHSTKPYADDPICTELGVLPSTGPWVRPEPTYSRNE